MTLTVCVGASGSGKTTFLEDVHKSHKCTYIRQYHNMRPYIKVSAIPNFDPTELPYWEIYVNEKKDSTIKVGGTMAGEFTPGLSGGQRKLLLFELIYQRTAKQTDLLLVFDEPFAGVTDDFVPFITSRLTEMRQRHNILLVTNDHVSTLTKMANNTITVSAIDRTVVTINQEQQVDREKAILALSKGDEYHYQASGADLKFFFDVELFSNQALTGIAVFTGFSFALMIGSFWDSDPENAVLVLVGGGIVAFFCVNPYLLALVEWRNAMLEEAEALMHASKDTNKALKSALTVFIIVIISLIEYGVVNLVINGLESVRFWVAMLFDSFSMTFPLICLGLFTRLPFQSVQIIGTLPFLLLIFLSTTFSPGSGVPVLKEFRYVFARFYFWCMIETVEDQMEGCPSDEGLNLFLLIFTGIVGVILFVIAYVLLAFKQSITQKREESKRATLKDDEYRQLQQTLYGADIGKSIHTNQSDANVVEEGPL